MKTVNFVRKKPGKKPFSTYFNRIFGLSHSQTASLLLLKNHSAADSTLFFTAIRRYIQHD